LSREAENYLEHYLYGEERWHTAHRPVLDAVLMPSKKKEGKPWIRFNLAPSKI
jgi:hypothetical protein